MDALPAAVDPRAGFNRGGDLGQSNESTEHSAEFPVRRFPFFLPTSNGTNDAELQSSAFFVALLSAAQIGRETRCRCLVVEEQHPPGGPHNHVTESFQDTEWISVME
jgi:hypothetical protein